MLSYFVAQNRLDWRNILASPAVAASDRWTARLWPVRYHTRTMRKAAWFGKDFEKTCRKDQGEPSACRGKLATEELASA